MVTVERTGKQAGSTAAGLQTLTQRFLFDGVSADRLAELLWTCPLVGDRAVFAGKSCRSTQDREDSRQLMGFVPAPGFSFDVAMRRVAPTSFVVRFSQPAEATPYLAGDVLWRFLDEDGGAVFDEQINTAVALEHVDEPLSGAKPSLRRWMFFKVGHAAIMGEMAKNLAALASGG